MELQYKPDTARAQTYWRAYWEHAVLDRPCVVVTAPKDPAHPVPAPAYMAGARGDTASALDCYERWAAATYFGGEAMPAVDISFGPDQFAAFLGAPLVLASAEQTSWTTPSVSDWDAVRFQLDETSGSTWQRLLAFLRAAAERGQGRYLVNMLDLHSNLDALRGLRGTQALCFDLIDRPDAVERALDQVRQLYAPVYEAVFAAGQMQRGTTGWIAAYCEQRYAVIQCDVMGLLGPAHARRFVLPALAEEAAFLEHCIFHYDGPQALRHLEAILALPHIDVIQWVPGDGQPRTVEWMDVLHKIQAAGKGLWLYDWTLADIHQHYHELRPEGVCFQLSADSPQQADELLDWLRQHT